METTKNKAITIETMVNAPIEKVWACWTEPKHITKWNQASPDWHTPLAENDVREGGKFKSTMAARDGSMSFDFEGVYTHVVPQKELAYKMADGRAVKVTFSESGSSVKVVESFDPEDENPVDMQREGWQAILDSFKAHTEAQ